MRPFVRSGASEVSDRMRNVRRMGLEQEFFLVDRNGSLCDQADQFLMWCRYEAELSSLDPRGFQGECVKSMVEVATPPCLSFEHLSSEYLGHLQVALKAAQGLGLRLYTHSAPTLWP